MALARLNIPSIVVPCGYQLGGHCGGKEVDIEEVYRRRDSFAKGVRASSGASWNALDFFLRRATERRATEDGIARAAMG
jgi:dihydroxyacid dehydratase/phosphogluconate dehydratase